MKKLFASAFLLLSLICCLSGCATVGEKNTSLTIIYGVAATLSLLLMVVYCCLIKKRNVWFIVMFSAISVVNIGYFCLAISASLSEALLANRIAYLGQVVLPLAMLMIILNVTNTKTAKWLPYCLLALSAVILFIAGSPGYLDIYYKEVSFEIVGGAGTLVKVYGPLHPLYLFYLIGYFVAMIAVIARAWIKKTVDTTSHGIIIAIAVFVNIGVWFIEQLTSIDFEMLSVSYIISELFLLGIHLVMNEYQRMKKIVKQVESVQGYSDADASTPDVMLEKPVVDEAASPERIEVFMMGLKTLTPTERDIYDAYIARVTTKEIMANMNIKESTVKYHSRNLYSKLGVSTRKELLELHKHIKSVKAKLEEVDNVTGK